MSESIRITFVYSTNEKTRNFVNVPAKRLLGFENKFSLAET